MKTFQEYMGNLTEASGKEKVQTTIELNKGREGKSLLNIKGKEIPNSIYLGAGEYAIKGNNSIELYTVDGISEKEIRTYISKKAFEHLKKLK
ncbi:hypothetical protein [Providencia phage PSTRCR_121]|nr:hypothetical protein [Providencia phage PSTRCR_121]